MFGVSLGALIGLLGTIVTSMYQIYKTKKSCKTQEDNQLLMQAKIEAYNNVVSAYKKVSDEMNAQGKEMVEKYKQMLIEQTDKLNECASKLENYSAVEDKIDDLIKILDLLSELDECVRLGLSEKNHEITNKVK